MNIQESFKKNLEYISQKEVSPQKIAKQFVKSNTRDYLTIGTIDVPTGNIVVADPLVYLGTNYGSPVLEKKIKKGTYPVEVAILKNKNIGTRMCTVRLKIKETPAEYYECALPTEETTVYVATDGIVSGFPVDAGMISICDKQVAEEYNQFLNDWHDKNPDSNHYDDYFEQFFQESYQKLPNYQREEGDFIEWTNPQTNHKLVMVASGLGDGFYQSFWGYDKDNEICELIVPLINPDLFETI